MSAYTLLKHIHVLLAIVAVGFNASYGIWLARASREPEHLGYVLRGIKLLDDRFANPAYGLLLLTGLAMVFVGHLSLTTFWIAGALVLWFMLMGTGGALYVPTLRRQIAALESGGANNPEYRRLAQRGTLVGLALLAMVMMILVLMVFKPTL
jgi:uncharacterized membrane protein